VVAHSAGLGQRRITIRAKLAVLGTVVVASAAGCILMLAVPSSVAPPPMSTLGPPQVEAEDATAPGNRGLFDTWYVNVRGATARDQCMRKQLEKAQVTPNRYNADVFAMCNNTHTFADCLKRQGLGDCVKGGIDWQSIRARADGMASLDTASHIISNWCSHKRLFSQLAESNSAPFAMVLEDDAVLNSATFKMKVESFLLDYAATEWDMVVIDPLYVQFDIVHEFKITGAMCNAFKVGSHHGRDVWQIPRTNRPAQRCMVQHCNFCGNQALLVRTSALKQVVARMESMRVLPLDWLPRYLNRSLAWRPQLAMNPYGLDHGIPDFCSKEVTVSTIEGKPTITNITVNSQDVLTTRK